METETRENKGTKYVNSQTLLTCCLVGGRQEQHLVPQWAFFFMAPSDKEPKSLRTHEPKVENYRVLSRYSCRQPSGHLTE